MKFLADAQQLAVTGAALVGAYAAFTGVNAWRRQLTGKTEYEVGLTVLRAAYKVREGIAVVRQPFMSSSEAYAALKEEGADALDGELDPRKILDDGRPAAYAVRWKNVASAMEDLDVARIEAEVVWGSDASDPILSLRRCANELGLSISDYLEDLGEGKNSIFGPEERREIKAIIFAKGRDDQYRDKVNTAIVGIEDFIRPKLGHKRQRSSKRIEQNAKS